MNEKIKKEKREQLFTKGIALFAMIIAAISLFVSIYSLRQAKQIADATVAPQISITVWADSKTNEAYIDIDNSGPGVGIIIEQKVLGITVGGRHTTNIIITEITTGVSHLFKQGTDLDKAIAFHGLIKGAPIAVGKSIRIVSLDYTSFKPDITEDQVLAELTEIDIEIKYEDINGKRQPTKNFPAR